AVVIHAAGAADVLDNDRLLENFSQPLGEQTGHDVVRAAWREWIDHGERPCRPVGGMGSRREAQANGSKQPKKMTRHDFLPRDFFLFWQQSYSELRRRRSPQPSPECA